MNFSTIQSLVVTFSNDQLNNYAQGDVPDFDLFFQENELDGDLIGVLNLKIPLSLTICSGDIVCVPSLLNKCVYKCHSLESNSKRNVRTQRDMEECFRSAVQNNQTFVKIEVMTEQLYFHPDFNGGDLDQIFSTREEMIASINANPRSFVPGPVPVGSSAGVTQPPPVPTNEFCHSLLPSNMKHRHDNYMNPDVVVPICDLILFMATASAPQRLKHFHKTCIAGDKVILCNGAILAASSDSKKFHKNVPCCTAVSPHGLRVWCKGFANHANA
jgi:hypothetical protein